MQIIVHRGSKEIGGSCVEIKSASGKSILLDMGIPLTDEANDMALEKLIPASLTLDKNKHLGVLISHAHQDHFGLIELATEREIDIYANEITTNIINESGFWLRDQDEDLPISNFKVDEFFEIGEFKIKTYRVDHTYDAVAFLIYIDGKKIFYTGDFRNHGNVDFFSKLLQHEEIKNADIMLIEGTTIGNDEEHKAKSEKDLIPEFVQFFNNHEGLPLIACSSQNFDRIVNIIKTANLLKKELVIDMYTYNILHTYENNALNGALTKVKVFLPDNQKIKIVNSERFDKLCPKNQRVFEEDFKENYKNYIVLYKASYNKLFSEVPECATKAKLAYSMWQGYFEKDKRLQSFLEKYNIETKHIHTSGHASDKAIITLVQNMTPKNIIPIHTMHAGKFCELFPNTIISSDGQVIDF